MEILTAELKKLVDGVSPGVGNVKLLPATSYVMVHGEGGRLKLTATDGVNFLTVSALVAEQEEFGPVVVQAESFIKLPSKTTKPSMRMNVLPDALEIVGNGKYRVPVLDLADFPKIQFEAEKILAAGVTTEELKKMFGPNKTAVATDMNYPMLTGYYVNKGVVTTDKIRMVLNNNESFFGEDCVLMSQRFIDLLSGFTTPVTFSISREGNLCAQTSDRLLIGPQLAGLKQYPNLEKFFSLAPKGQFSVNKEELLAVLDRIMLFVDPEMDYGVRLSCNEGATELIVSDLRGSSEERIPFSGWEDGSFSIELNTRYFVELLASLNEKQVSIQYEEGLPVKIVEGNVSILLSTIGPVQ